MLKTLKELNPRKNVSFSKTESYPENSYELEMVIVFECKEALKLNLKSEINSRGISHDDLEIIITRNKINKLELINSLDIFKNEIKNMYQHNNFVVEYEKAVIKMLFGYKKSKVQMSVGGDFILYNPCEISGSCEHNTIQRMKDLWLIHDEDLLLDNYKESIEIYERGIPYHHLNIFIKEKN